MDRVTPKPREAAPRAAARAAPGATRHRSAQGGLAQSLNESPRVRQLLRLSRMLQRKRAKPDEGEFLEEYNKWEKVYNEALGKGTGYLAGLAERKANLSKRWKPASIVRKQYDELLNLHANFDTTMSHKETEDEKGRRVEYEITTRHKAAERKTDEHQTETGVPNYSNCIILPEGRIIARFNFSGTSKSPLSNSEVLWTQYSMALAHYKANFATRPGAATLAQIAREGIINEETMGVIWMVRDNDEKKKTVTPDTPDGKALLGTPNGKSSVWLLRDHLEEVGGKTIQSIDVEGEDIMRINIG